MVFRLYWKQAGDRQNMIIRQLNIKNSGEIHDKTLEFSPGINVLYGENESERAIVHTYIKNMFLGDISEAIYDNAVFAAKLKSPTEQDLARELQKFMTGYQGTADSSMDLGRAMQMLKMSRKGYLVQADRKQKETEQERQKLLTRMDDIISDLNDLNRKLDQINEKDAKKSEAADKSIENNADYVLTFGEAIEMLRGKEVELEPAEETKQEGSVFGKRFGNGGGVTNAVIECFKERGESADVKVARCSGAAEVKKALLLLKVGRLPEDFIEGMMCQGGCVGGPSNLKQEMAFKKDRDAVIAKADGRGVWENLKNYDMDSFSMHRSYEKPEA